MKTFIKIGGTRVRLSQIKKYRIVGDDKRHISIFYTASQKRMTDNELFDCGSEEEAKIVMLELDQLFLN